ncbi:hypothetical protein Vadar_015479 [Vaccinium darrowii]|uniref:Uncharacterized protein n=1 Tax=Vaccinium darrowii TaxID=229202 RepID=A0ACB7YXL5_9ERIC|nr:hypothetical protein Vadar_015479 [Vaccinium darrowii]
MSEDGKSSNTSNTSEGLRVDDPFYISPFDSPSAALISPPLNGDNYGSWVRAMTMALRAKNKLGFVDGSVQQPGENEVKEKSKWERCNDLVASWILNSVSDDIRSSILYAHTARAIWIDLSERFLQSNAPQIYQLKQSISALKQEDLSVSAYFTKLKSLWDELNSLQTFPPCTCGSGKLFSERLQQDRAMEFLQDAAALNSTARSRNNNSNRLMDGRNNHNTNGGNRPHPGSGNRSYASEGHSLYSGGGSRSHLDGGNRPYNAGGNNSSGGGHNSYSGGRNNSNRKVKYHCEHCDTDGHTKERCYKIIGYPPKRLEFSNFSAKAKNKTIPAVVTQEQYDNLLAMLSSGKINHSSNLAGPINEEDDWTGEYS